METYNDTAYKTFVEETAGILDNKEGHAVELGTAERSVKLATGASNALGVFKQKLQNGQVDSNIRLLGKGGTVKVVAGGIIAKGSRVKVASGGKFITASTGDRSVGIKLTQGDSADNDVIEILDVIEVAP